MCVAGGEECTSQKEQSPGTPHDAFDHPTFIGLHQASQPYYFFFASTRDLKYSATKKHSSTTPIQDGNCVQKWVAYPPGFVRKKLLQLLLPPDRCLTITLYWHTHYSQLGRRQLYIKNYLQRSGLEFLLH